MITVLLVSIPMWIFLPCFAWISGSRVIVRPDWLVLLIGVVLINGITEEVIHRGFVFGDLREGRSFVRAASIWALVFAAQHLYLIVTIGWAVGLSSMLLAACLAYPMAFVFERGGRSIAGPAILHTSTSTPAIIVAFARGAHGHRACQAHGRHPGLRFSGLPRPCRRTGPVREGGAHVRN